MKDQELTSGQTVSLSEMEEKKKRVPVTDKDSRWNGNYFQEL